MRLESAGLKATVRSKPIGDSMKALGSLNDFYGVNLSLDAKRSIPGAILRQSSRVGAGITVGEVTGQRMCTVNNPNSRPRRRGMYVAYFSNQPHAVVVESRNLVRLKPNEVMLLNSEDSWELRLPKAYTLTSVAIERELILDLLPSSASLRTGRLWLPHKLDQLIGNFILSAHSIAKAGQFERVAGTVATSFVSMMSLGLLSGPAFDEAGGRLALDARCQQIKEYIDAHFARPGVCVGEIAKRLKISPRYVHMAFISMGKSPSEYLRWRRLQGSAALLADCSWRSQTITDIAYACGFSSSSYFSNEFKREFGLSPRFYRLRSMSVMDA